MPTSSAAVIWVTRLASSAAVRVPDPHAPYAAWARAAWACAAPGVPASPAAASAAAVAKRHSRLRDPVRWCGRDGTEPVIAAFFPANLAARNVSRVTYWPDSGEVITCDSVRQW